MQQQTLNNPHSGLYPKGVGDHGTPPPNLPSKTHRRETMASLPRYKHRVKHLQPRLYLKQTRPCQNDSVSALPQTRHAMHS